MNKTNLTPVTPRLYTYTFICGIFLPLVMDVQIYQTPVTTVFGSQKDRLKNLKAAAKII